MSEKDSTSLEQRIKLLEDRAELSELRARFCILTDDRRWEDLADLFAQDGVLDVRGPVQGRDAIREFASHLPEVWESWFHTVDTEVTEIDGDAATGISCFNAPFVAEGTSFNALGRYEDRFVRVDGAWRFARRSLSFSVSAPVSAGWSAELPEGLRAMAG